MTRNNNITKITEISAGNEKNLPLAAIIETSGRLGSVAIAQGDVLLDKAFFSAPVKHSAEVFPTLRKLLEQQNKSPENIGQVYISIGPGSFTGLRIAVTIAKMMHLANNTDIIAVDTLDVLAQNIYEYISQTGNTPQTIATILDAKRGEFFIAAYKNDNNRYIKTLESSVMGAEEFAEKFSNLQNPIAIFGEGLVYYSEKFKSSGIKILDERYWNPLPENLHRLGWQKAQTRQFADPVALTPTYLRCLELKIKNI